MKTVRKRCANCGHVAMVKPRERRCKHVVEHVVGLNPSQTRYCWGRLTAVKRPKRAQSDLDKATHAGAQLDAALQRLARTVTSIKLWVRRRKYYLDKAEGRIKSYERRQAAPKKDRFTRAIELPDD